MANLSKFNVELVAATYQFFTGNVPTSGGFTYLIDSPENPTDLTDPYYAQSLMGLRKFGESIIVNIVIVSAIFAIVWYGLSQVTDPLMPV